MLCTGLVFLKGAFLMAHNIGGVMRNMKYSMGHSFTCCVLRNRQLGYYSPHYSGMLSINDHVLFFKGEITSRPFFLLPICYYIVVM